MLIDQPPLLQSLPLPVYPGLISSKTPIGAGRRAPSPTTPLISTFMASALEGGKGAGLSSVRFLGMIFLFFARVGSVRFPVRLHPGVQLGIRAL
jgi:hypothetical protein